MAVGMPVVVRNRAVEFREVDLFQADVIRADEFRHPVDFHLRVQAEWAVAKAVLLPDDYLPPDGLAEYQCRDGNYLGEGKAVAPESGQDGFL